MGGKGKSSQAERVLAGSAWAFLTLVGYFLLSFNFWKSGLVSMPVFRWYYAKALSHHLIRETVHLNVHALAGETLVVLGLFQISDGFRARHRRLHRAMGFTYLGVGAFTSVYAIFLTRSSYGGRWTLASVAVLVCLWGITAYRAMRSLYLGEPMVHRRWMLRNYFLTLSTVLVRPYYVLLFLLLPGYSPEILFPTAFGFTTATTIVVSELLLRKTRGSGRPSRTEDMVIERSVGNG